MVLLKIFSSKYDMKCELNNLKYGIFQENVVVKAREKTIAQTKFKILDFSKSPLSFLDFQKVQKFLILYWEQCKVQKQLVNYALMIGIIYAKGPKCLEEALGDDKWMEVMHSKYGSIMKNSTWDLVDRPPKCKVISTQWVSKTKYKFDGPLDKSWLVAKGFAQVYGYDYSDSFAPQDD